MSSRDCAPLAPSALDTQVIGGPRSPADQPRWLAEITGWRDRCRRSLGIGIHGDFDDGTPLWNVPEMQWTQRAYSQVQMHPYDRYFYEVDTVEGTGRYTVSRWLDDLRERYGGIDAALIWPTYTNLGIDDRNSYDLVSLMPGGIEGVRAVVRELHAANVSVLWPIMRWDTGTRPGGLASPEVMTRLQRETGADGFNGDTYDEVPRAFFEYGTANGAPPALQAEGGGSFDSLRWTTLGWGEFGAWGGLHDDGIGGLHEDAPVVDAFKWLQPRHMTSICRRWDKNRRSAIQTAWFNGIGYETWENVWGIWNGFTPRDAEAFKRLQPLYRHFGGGGLGLLASPGWEPHAPTLQPSVYASRFPGLPHGGGRRERTLWTLVERDGARAATLPLLSVDADEYADCVWYDVYRGARLAPARSADGRTLTISAPIEPLGYGAILATRSAGELDVEIAPAAVSDSALADVARRAASLGELLSRQAAAAERGGPLDALGRSWHYATQRRIRDPQHLAPFPPVFPYYGDALQQRGAPPGSVFVAGGPFRFISSGTEIEGDQHSGVDVQFEWEESPRRHHDHSLHVGPFFIDAAPVSCERYAQYLRQTGYTPDDARGWLRDWDHTLDPIAYPPGNASVPVTGISLSEAQKFCAWARGRLPTSVEWQYAAQGGDDGKIYPWGSADDEARRPPVSRGRHAPAPSASDAPHAAAGASPFGLVDLVGNVWQYTSDVFEDEHTRFVLLKGGTHYDIRHASTWYFPNTYRLDRHNKYMLFDDAYERAATLGMRCAYEAKHGDGHEPGFQPVRTPTPAATSPAGARVPDAPQPSPGPTDLVEEGSVFFVATPPPPHELQPDPQSSATPRLPTSAQQAQHAAPDVLTIALAVVLCTALVAALALSLFRRCLSLAGLELRREDKERLVGGREMGSGDRAGADAPDDTSPSFESMSALRMLRTM